MRSTKRTIPVSEPWLTAMEAKYASDAVRSGYISGSKGEYIAKFEAEFARFCGSRHAISCSSGTAALQLAVRAAGIGPGDEVIAPTFTNIATILAIVYAGAKPVLVDSRSDTWCMDESKIKQKTTRKTKAILPVHIYGHPVDMGPVLELSRKHDLTVIEDAAESQGALYRGRQTGSIGDMGCFSFYANKIITTGEGGMVTTDDDELDHKLRSLKNLAFGDTARYTHTDLGYNYRMPNVLAAIGLAQMGRVNELIEKKRKIADWYKDGLSQAEGLELPTEKPWARNVYWMFGIVLDRSAGLNRNSLMRKLSRSGVETRAFFVPMHKQRVFHSIGLFKGLRLPVSERLSEGGLYLPSGATLTRREVEYVCQQVISALSHR